MSAEVQESGNKKKGGKGKQKKNDRTCRFYSYG